MIDFIVNAETNTNLLQQEDIITERELLHRTNSSSITVPNTCQHIRLNALIEKQLKTDMNA